MVPDHPEYWSIKEGESLVFMRATGNWHVAGIDNAAECERRTLIAMGYETALHLVDVKIKDESIPIVRKALKTRRRSEVSARSNIFLGEGQFQDNDTGSSPSSQLASYHSQHEPDEDDGTVPS